LTGAEGTVAGWPRPWRASWSAERKASSTRTQEVPMASHGDDRGRRDATACSPQSSQGSPRPRPLLRRLLVGLAVLVALWLVACFIFFVWPPAESDAPAHADAVVVLSGGLNSRLDPALSLM